MRVDSNKVNAGLYIHIPFCIKKCPYCDFFSTTNLSLEDQFTNSIELEIKRIAQKKLVFDTIYFGGGTPSVFKSINIGKIINAAHINLNILSNAEITIEINPGTVNLQKLIDYRSFGINRINIGVQSFNDKELGFLGRIHSAQDAVYAIEKSRKVGFENIGLDLIYGLPEQTKKAWLQNMKKAIQFSPEHLSCYMLTYELNTFMHNSILAGKILPMDDGSVGLLFQLTMETLEDNGYIQYEISNFAKVAQSQTSQLQSGQPQQTDQLKPDKLKQDQSNPQLKPDSFRSKHNMKYWSFAPYIGLGPSAHSFLKSTRSWNYKDINKFIENVNANKTSVKEREVLSKDQQITEVIYLGLRTKEGIRMDFFEKLFNINFYNAHKKIIEKLEEQGNIEIKDNCCRLTRKGMIFLDTITLMFL